MLGRPANIMEQAGMKTMLRAMSTLIAMAMLGIAYPASATTDSNLTVTTAGAQSGSYAYIVVSPGATGSCGNIIYIDVTTDSGRAMYSTALTARVTGRPISRVDYAESAGNVCYASLLAM